MKEALKEANIKIDDIDAVACTYGPGLVGALLVGVSYAKALSYAANKPLIGVNHIQGHIAANYITYKDLKPPFLTLLISGGNTQLVLVKDYTEFEILLLLAQNAGIVFSKEQIYDSVWEEPYFGDYNIVMSHIRNIREKIEDNPSKPIYIQTVWGVGYRFNKNER